MNLDLPLAIVIINELILISTFIYGTVTILFKKGATYFKFFVCAIGCCGLAEFLRISYYICYGEQAPITGMFSIGYFGCFLFMVSASFGPFDSIVDDGNKGFIKYRLLGLIAPIVLALLTYFMYLIAGKTFTGEQLAIIIIVYIPKIIASYYNFKHLIFPDMGYGFIKGVKPCNIFALLFYLVDICYTYGALMGNNALICIFGLLSTLTLVGLTWALKRGLKQWKI